MDAELKSRLFLAAAGGAGAAFALAAFVTVGLWFMLRPKPLKAWNTQALKASLDSIDTEGERDNLVFEYMVENTTSSDYRVSSAGELSVAARLTAQKGLTMDREQKGLRLDYPIFIPAGQRVRLTVHLMEYSYSSENVIDKAIRGTAEGPWEKYRVPPAAGADTTTQKHREEVKAYVAEELKNLDGFVIFDESHRYEIELPRDW